MGIGTLKLSDKHEFLDLCKIGERALAGAPRSQPVKIDPAGELRTVERNRECTWLLFAADQCRDVSCEGGGDGQCDETGAGKIIDDFRHGIKWIRVILFESK